MELLKRLDSYLTLIERFVVIFGVLAIAALVFTAVITRFLLSFSFTWIEEVARYSMLWVAFMGGILAVSKNRHIGVDVIFSVLPKKYHRVYSGIVFFVSGVFMLYFSLSVYGLIQTVKAGGQVSVSMTWFPMYLIYVSALVGTFLMSVEFFKFSFRLFKKGNE